MGPADAEGAPWPAPTKCCGWAGHGQVFCETRGSTMALSLIAGQDAQTARSESINFVTLKPVHVAARSALTNPGGLSRA